MTTTDQLVNSGQLWRVTSPSFVAGAVSAQDGSIVTTAPILKQFRGTTLSYLKRIVAQRNWKLERL